MGMKVALLGLALLQASTALLHACASPPATTIRSRITSLRCVADPSAEADDRQSSTAATVALPDQVARTVALLAVPLAWGTYGPVVELAYGLPHPAPSPVLSILFVGVSAASLQLVGLASGGGDVDNERRRLPEEPLGSEVRAGVELGLWLFLGSNIQLVGLQLTDAARAGFLVQLTTVIVPLVEALLLGRRLPPQLLAACAVATAGVTSIALGSGALDGFASSSAASSALRGDALIGCSALLYSAHVVRLGEFAAQIEPEPEP